MSSQVTAKTGTKKTAKFSYLFAASIVAALATRLVPDFIESTENKVMIIFLILAFVAVWCCIVAKAFISFGWRGAWLLLTAPIALEWPMTFVLAFVSKWLFKAQS